jgi:putative membrane protein
MNKQLVNRLITIVSVAIPVVVAILFRVKIDGYDLSFLPPIYASINAVTAVLLVAALWAIKNGKRTLHEFFMRTCIALSLLFLIMYVAYHMTSDPTGFGGEGVIRYVYYFILITHIILSIGVVPLVLFTYARAYNEEFARHKKLARITFPIWLYVAVTGVIVYLMISPYYV